ncbi:amino acid permease [Corynebacterium sp. CCM 8862]|uniref:Amino acid permease n=2 Tax=Corynebacterium mendelii TaxID=2765362 RepID=A0A939E2V7_9CORY|nr:amino acid permease [Corynebacterium mendelii]
MWTLVSLIIGSTVGTGIFALPRQSATAAGPGAMLIGWAIAGVGMLSIAFVFQILATRKPHLDSGVYSYVRAGLGDFVGFASAWGYWLGSVIAQVGYASLFFATLGHYVPIFGNDHPFVQALCVSAMTWAIFLALTKGVKQAAFLNIVTTVAKLLPILAFLLVIAFFSFSWDRFSLHMWEHSSGAGVMDQVKGIMVYTVWAFIGVEGASVYSKQAAKRTDVGRATVIGFLSVLLMLVAVGTLSYGVLTQEELAALDSPSMAGVMEAAVGPWGGALISIGLMLSVLGAYVSWQMLCAEPITLMAQDRLLPAKLGKTRNGAPWTAQLISSIVIQIMVVVFFLNETTYDRMVSLATMMYMLPYLFSSLYLVMLCTRGKGITHPQAGTSFDDSGPAISAATNRKHLLIGSVALVYSIWLFYAAELKYLLFGALLVIPGLVPYIWQRNKMKQRPFNTFEWVIVALVVIGSIVAIYGLYSGRMSL